MGKKKDIIVLESRLDAAGADALKVTLLERLAAGTGLTLDAGEVSLIDTPAIQVLLGASRSCASNDSPFKIETASEPFREAFEILGLDNHIQDWGLSNG